MAEEAMFLRSIFPENCPTFEESWGIGSDSIYCFLFQ
jgi:hypothetical protein